MADRVLIVDDEKVIVKGIKFSLEADGMEVDCAYDGLEGLEKIKNNQYDIVLLDIMLPEMDGYAVCQQVREFSDVPIIMVSAKSEDIDKILGLEYGADDYMTKPFNILEVKARIKAIKRRTKANASSKEKSDRIVFGNLNIERSGKRVYLSGHEIPLTTKEYEVLELLALNPEKIYAREELLSLIWGYDYPGDARTVDVHIRRLREKLEPNPSSPIYVRTKWGMGYFFKA